MPSPTILRSTSGRTADARKTTPPLPYFHRGSSGMSEEFEVTGPHEHEVEHRGQHDPFAGRIAVMTAIFATTGALFGYMAGETQNEALLFKNKAAITRPKR